MGDTNAVMKSWRKIQSSGQMFDMLEWNCARTALEVLNAGLSASCRIPLEKKLWTPRRVEEYIQLLQPKMQKVSSVNVNKDSIVARQIVLKQGAVGIPPIIVVVVALSCFFGTLIIAVFVGVVLIMKIKAAATQQLDRNLANLLISAAASNTGTGPKLTGTSGPEDPAAQKYKAKKSSVLPAPSVAQSIHQDMDIGATDGKTDKDEFFTWAREHNFTNKQAKIMWADLDRDHNNCVSSKEWEKYIDKRPNLKWLATRLQSVRSK